MPKQFDSCLVKEVRAGLAELADPAKAPGMLPFPSVCHVAVAGDFRMVPAVWDY